MSIIGISGKIGSGKDTIAYIIQYLCAHHAAGYTQLTTEIDFNDYLRNSHRSTWKIKKMAGKLKQVVSLLTGISIEDLEKEVVKNRELGIEWKRWFWSNYKFLDYPDQKVSQYFSTAEEAQIYKESLSMELAPICKELKFHILTVRRLLQELGTEALRNVIHPNVHINALFADYRPSDDTKRASMGNVIDYSNCSFPNWLITDVRFPNEAQAILDRNGILIRVNRWREDHFIYNVKEHPSETSLDNYDEFHYTINNNGTIQDLIEEVKKILIAKKII